MAYFADLSMYSYARPTANVWNIGWLDSTHEFTKGFVHPNLVAKLIVLAVNKTVQQMRGFHYCEFCSLEDIAIEDSGTASLLGTAEIWIPAADRKAYYASPDFIVHYIQQHMYRPPDVYLTALENLDVEAWQPWDIAALAEGAAP